ncbi:PQQ-binding-like beta-propeller repeat protein [Streptomyces albicerus]|uniref:PQQ-binding-like beta-propeller repeat protein n=1 Tax=Streptomyces albicerus TaxID=2569859 RepID=UPI00124B37DB|nr:PQQ-binding-like beta-propeller repeat protein [Streptomyces albicerus]
MAGPGRPRRLNPDTEEAAALAGFLQQLTQGLGTRELSEQFPGTAGKSQWALWLKGDKDVSLEVLRQLIEARLPAGHRAKALKRAKELCASAEAARAGRGRPVPAQRQSAEAETTQAYKELAAARQGLLDAREALHRSKNLVLMLLWMIESLNTRIEALQLQALPQQPTASGTGRFQAELARAEDQLSRSETELTRARAERDQAQQLHAAAHRRAEELERRLAELELRTAPLTPAPATETAAPLPEPSADEYELALERVSSGLDANARELQQLQERLEGAEDPSPRVPAPSVVHEKSADNLDNVSNACIADNASNVDNRVARTSARAADEVRTAEYVVRGEVLSRTVADNPATSPLPLSPTPERHSMAAPADGTVAQRTAGRVRRSPAHPRKPAGHSGSVRAVALLTIGAALLFGVTSSQGEPTTRSRNSSPTAGPSGAPAGRSGTGPRGTVYLRTDTAVTAVDRATGTKRWSLPATPTSAVLSDGLLYLSDGAFVEAVDAATGDKLWSTPLKQGDLEVFAVTADAVYVNGDDNLIALDVTTGEEQWTKPGISGSVAGNGMIYGWNADVDAGETVYAVDAATGESRWSRPTTGYLRGLTVHDGTAYIYVGPGILHAVNASTGEERWSYTTRGGGGWSDPLVVKGTVYVTAGRNHPDVGGLFAVDAATGKKRWIHPGTDDRGIGGTAVFADNTVYVDFGDDMLAVDAADGKEKWSRALARYGPDHPQAAGDVVYTGDFEMTDGVLYIGRWTGDSSEVVAVDPATGREHWSYPALGTVPVENL